MPIEEGEIDSEKDQDPSILEVPAINWAHYVGVKNRPIRGTRPKNHSLRRPQLGPRKGCAKNRKEPLNRLTAATE